MSDEITNPLKAKLAEQKRKEYQAIVQKEINSNFSDPEARAILVKQMILLVEPHLPNEIKDELHFLHLEHKKYNQPNRELVS